MVVVGISLASFGALGIIDLLRRALATDEESLVLRTNVMLSSLMLTSSLLPLAISELNWCVRVSSGLFAVLSGALFFYVVNLIRDGRTALRRRSLSLPLLLITPVVILIPALNALWFNSIVVYKVALLYGVLLLIYRLSLSISYLMLSRTSD